MQENAPKGVAFVPDAACSPCPCPCTAGVRACVRVCVCVFMLLGSRRHRPCTLFQVLELLGTCEDSGLVYEFAVRLHNIDNWHVQHVIAPEVDSLMSLHWARSPSKSNTLLQRRKLSLSKRYPLCRVELPFQWQTRGGGVRAGALGSQLGRELVPTEDLN